MAIAIIRHGVPSDHKTKLSPLQTELLNCTEKVRIASAPTGAGKSYAFQRAMIDNDERILFIVPTRRLAQNLKFSLINALKEAGWDQKKAKNKVTVWSSDTKEKLKEAGIIGKDKISITSFRIREIYELDETRTGGEMIFATPEVVSGILLRGKYLNFGQSDAGIIDLLTQFDHIVFDEFHTIEPRGFGMAAVLSKLAAELQNRCRAKISFLSATALDIKPTLLAMEVPEAQIKELREEVIDECDSSDRTIHGDVQLLFEKRDSLAELIATYADEIKTESQQNHLVVVIYNKLSDLQRQSTALAATLEHIGVSRKKRLLINSIDDSRQGDEAEFETDFTVGRYKNPNDFRVLIATSSVELGVTFNTRLLFMEPGFEPFNFLQRYGRAARGDVDGKVIVRWDDWLHGKMPWLRRLIKWAEKNAGKNLSINDLSKQLRRTVVEFFEEQPDFEKQLNSEEQPNNDAFVHLPNRAKYTAGLYWHLLQNQKSNNKYIKQRLFAHCPPQARTVAGLLKEVRKMENNPNFGEAAKKWCVRFENEAKILRNIERRIKIVEGSGNTLLVGENFLQREAPHILDTGLLSVDEDGNLEIHIGGYFCLDDKSRYVPKQKRVFFPYKSDGITLEDNYQLVDEWCNRLTEPMEKYLWKGYEKSIRAAEKLVRFTGLVVSEYDDPEMDAPIGVL